MVNGEKTIRSNGYFSRTGPGEDKDQMATGQDLKPAATLGPEEYGAFTSCG
jgi:hypothetical protein